MGRRLQKAQERRRVLRTNYGDGGGGGGGGGGMALVKANQPGKLEPNQRPFLQVKPNKTWK